MAQAIPTAAITAISRYQPAAEWRRSAAEALVLRTLERKLLGD